MYTWVNIYLSWFFSCHSIVIILNMVLCVYLFEYVRVFQLVGISTWSLSIPFPLLVGAFKFRNDFEEFSNTEKKHVECWFWMILIISYCQWLTSSNCHPETKSSLRKNDVFFWRLLVHHSISGGSMVDPVGHPSQAGIGHLQDHQMDGESIIHFPFKKNV